MTIFQIELNNTINELYWYLKKDRTMTYVPADALEFSTFEKCEKVRKEMDRCNDFHTQKMYKGTIKQKDF